MARDPSELAQAADGESVTVDRLEPPVIDALGADEQPQHLLRGDSLNHRGEDDDEMQRLFSSVDTTVALVATPQRILVVVPRAVSDRVYSIDYPELSECAVETGQLPVVRLNTGTRSFAVNLSAGEDSEPTVAYIRRQQTATEADDAPSESSVTAAKNHSTETAPDTNTADTTAADPLDRIERLAELRDKGVLTESEFESKKKQLLDKL